MKRQNEIKEWIKKRGSYAAGVDLYANHPKHKAQILRTLKRGNNRGLLLYELNKLLKYDETVPVIDKKETGLIETPSKNVFERNFPNIYLHQLPEELREPFIKQKQAFYTAANLKLQLNDLPSHQVKEARDLSERILFLWDFIDDVWRRIDYWLEHKSLVPTAPSVDYSKLTPKELFNTRQKYYVRVSKRKKTLERLMENADREINQHRKKVLLNRIDKKQKELLQLEIDIKEITKILKDE